MFMQRLIKNTMLGATAAFLAATSPFALASTVQPFAPAPVPSKMVLVSLLASDASKAALCASSAAAIAAKGSINGQKSLNSKPQTGALQVSPAGQPKNDGCVLPAVDATAPPPVVGAPVAPAAFLLGPLVAGANAAALAAGLASDESSSPEPVSPS